MAPDNAWADRERLFLADCAYVYGANKPVERTTYAVVRGIADLDMPKQTDLDRIYERMSWLRQAFAGEGLELQGEVA